MEAEDERREAEREAKKNNLKSNESPNAGEPQSGDAVASSSSRSGESINVSVPNYKGVVLVYERFTNRVSSIRGVRDFPIVLFGDGTFTKDVTGVLNNGVSASKAENPNKWGQWKGNVNNLKLKTRRGSFEKVFAAILSDPISNGLTLNKCYTGSNYTYRYSGDSSGVDTSATYNTFCFQKNGIFTHDSSTSIKDADFISSTRSDSAGFYKVSGNVIQLTYGNGSVAHRFFALYSNPSDPQFAISIGSAVFKP